MKQLTYSRSFVIVLCLKVPSLNLHLRNEEFTLGYIIPSIEHNIFSRLDPAYGVVQLFRFKIP